MLRPWCALGGTLDGDLVSRAWLLTGQKPLALALLLSLLLDLASSSTAAVAHADPSPDLGNHDSQLIRGTRYQP